MVTEVKPCLFVGLGGTGQNALLGLRRKFRLQMGENWKLPCLGYLWIDCQEKSRHYEYGQNDFIDRDVAFDQNETCYAKIEKSAVEHYFAAPEAHQRIFDWLDTDAKARGISACVDGAHQLRANGRLAFFNNYREIKKKIIDKAREITSGDVADAMQEFGADFKLARSNDVDVIFVFSVAGGSGAGMFLDMAYLIKHLSREVRGGGDAMPRTTAYTILPDVFIADKEIKFNEDDIQRTSANGYAALSELEYYSFNPDAGTSRESGRMQFTATWDADDAETVDIKDTAPFDAIYLIGGTNGSGKYNLSGVEDAVDMIADMLFLRFQENYVQNAIDTIEDNEKIATSRTFTEKVDEPDGEKRTLFEHPHSCAFSSFGLSKAFTEASRLRHAAAYHFAAEVVDQWIKDDKFRDKSAVEQARLKATSWCEQELLLDREGFSTALFGPWREEAEAVYTRIGSESNPEVAMDGAAVMRDLIAGQSELFKEWRRRISERARRSVSSLEQRVLKTLAEGSIFEADILLDEAASSLQSFKASCATGIRSDGLDGLSLKEVRERFRSLLSEVDDRASRLREAQRTQWPLRSLMSSEMRDQLVEVGKSAVAACVSFVSGMAAEHFYVSEIEKAQVRLAERVSAARRKMTEVLTKGDGAAFKDKKDIGLRPMFKMISSFGTIPRNIFLFKGTFDDPSEWDRYIDKALDAKHVNGRKAHLQARQHFHAELSRTHQIGSLIDLGDPELHGVELGDLKNAITGPCFDLLELFLKDDVTLPLMADRVPGNISGGLEHLSASASPYARIKNVVEQRKQMPKLDFVGATSLNVKPAQFERLKEVCRQLDMKLLDGGTKDTLIVTRVVHGFPLCGLEVVDQLHKDYLKRRHTLGRVDVHYSDKRVGKFPRIVLEDQRETRRVVETMSTLLQNVLLGIVQWEPDQQCYFFEYPDPDHVGKKKKTLVLGSNLMDAVKQVRSERSKAAIAHLNEELSHRRSQIFQDAEMVVHYQHILDYSCERLYPETIREVGDGETIRTSSKENNTFKRLRKELSEVVRQGIQDVEQFQDLSHHLHCDLDLVTEFVGPRDEPLLVLTNHRDDQKAKKTLRVHAERNRATAIDQPVIEPLVDDDNVVPSPEWVARMRKYGFTNLGVVSTALNQADLGDSRTSDSAERSSSEVPGGQPAPSADSFASPESEPAMPDVSSEFGVRRPEEGSEESDDDGWVVGEGGDL